MSSQALQLEDSECQSSCIRVMALRFSCSFDEAAIIWVTEGHAQAYRELYPFH
jgi:hypothetical protein